MNYRKHIRLVDYDYSNPGIYFITICTWNRFHLFGEIINGKMIYSEIGEIADEHWKHIPDHYEQTELYNYIIMPNHIHGLIGLGHVSPDSNPELGTVIGSFKSSVTKEIRERRGEACLATTEKIWQSNYYEHIVRDEKAFENITNYIIMNPENWEMDKENSCRSNTNVFYQWINTYWKN